MTSPENPNATKTEDPSMIDPWDGYVNADYLRTIEPEWDTEMARRFPEKAASKKTGRSVLDVAFKGAETPEVSAVEPETLSDSEDFNGVKIAKFERFEGESDADFERRSADRRKRKILVGLTYGPEALRFEDFETSDADSRVSLKNTIKNLAEADDIEFESDMHYLLRDVETPMDREGFEGVFEKLGDDRAALEIIYYATRDTETWSEMPEAREKGLDIVGQKKLGRAAIEAFYKKYPTAADLRALERELAEDPRFHGSVKESGVDLGPEYEDKDKFDVFEDALDRLGESIYGAQEEYMRCSEDVREYATEMFKKTEKRSAPEAFEPTEEEPVEEEPAVEEEPVVEPEKKPDPESVLATPETAPVETPTYAARAASRRLVSGGYRPYDYGYSRTPLFASSRTSGPSEFSRPHERKFNTKKPTESTLEKLSKTEFEHYRDLLAKKNTFGSPWHALVDGKRQSYQAYAANYIQHDLGPFVKANDLAFVPGAVETAISKPFRLSENRLAMIVYSILRKGDEESVEAHTLVQDESGKFKLMDVYRRTLDVESSAEGRIDWDWTAKRLEDIEVGDVVPRVAKEIEPVAIPGDPEFFAAGTAESRITLSED